MVVARASSASVTRDVKSLTKLTKAELIEPLSEREIEILKLVSQGLTNKEIAARLFLAEGTVKNYVTSILQKIDARDRTQAAIRARELGLL